MTHHVDNSLLVNSLEGQTRDWREGCEQKRFFVRNVGLDDLKAILVLPQPARVASFSAFLEANPGYILDSKLIYQAYVIKPLDDKTLCNRSIDTSLFALVREFIRNPFSGDTAQGEVLCQNAVHSGLFRRLHE